MGIGAVQNGYEMKDSMDTGNGKKAEEEKIDYKVLLQEKCEEILEKLRTGETEVSYPIGGQSFTEREWDRLMEKFDDIQENVRQKMAERFRKMEEKGDRAKLRNEMRPSCGKLLKEEKTVL